MHHKLEMNNDTIPRCIINGRRERNNGMQQKDFKCLCRVNKEAIQLTSPRLNGLRKGQLRKQIKQLVNLL